MAHTFTCLYVHVVFGTRFRRPLIAPEMRPKLWSYMGGIAREHNFRALTIGGMSEHAHVLLSLNPAIAVATAVQHIKAGSSAWMSRLIGKDFKWQEGYAAFSVSLSNLDSVRHYVDHQEEHHRKMDFATEWKLLLKKHGIVLPEIILNRPAESRTPHQPGLLTQPLHGGLPSTVPQRARD